ncbi:hypothetical protein OAK17_06035 [Alphaproteobacteria bacterium]|nr:hypothetical protein [Alphaproteobacteria bacterium]
MQISLSEFETVIYRSGVGIGLPNGIALEASLTASRMLLENIVSLGSFVDAFDLLEKGEAVEFEFSNAVNGEFIPRTEKKLLSCLFAGPSICDLLSLKNSKTNSNYITLRKVDKPIILLFQVLELSTHLNKKIIISYNVKSSKLINLACHSGFITFVSGNKKDLFDLESDSVMIQVSTEKIDYSNFELINFKNKKFELDEYIWDYFSKRAEYILVEATEESRINDAGGIINDND